MKMSYSQIIELWKIRLAFSSLGKVSNIWHSIPIPIVMLAIAYFFSNFNSLVVTIAVGFGVFYIIAAITLSFVIKKLVSNKSYKNRKYQLIAILFGTYGILVKVFLGIWALAMSLASGFHSEIEKPLIIQSRLSQFIWVSFMFIAIIAILNANNTLRKKSGAGLAWLNPNLAGWRKIYIAIPGLSILIGGIMARDGKSSFIFSVLEILFVFFMLYIWYFVILDIYELFLLVTNKWPYVNKKGSSFIVAENL